MTDRTHEALSVLQRTERFPLLEAACCELTDAELAAVVRYAETIRDLERLEGLTVGFWERISGAGRERRRETR